MGHNLSAGAYSVLEEMYYKYVPVNDTLRHIAISDMFTGDLQSSLLSAVAEFDKVYNKKLATKHDVLEYVLAFAAHNKLPLRLHGQNQTCTAIKKLLLIKRSLCELIEMEYLDYPPVSIAEITKYQQQHPESVLSVYYSDDWADPKRRFFLKSDAFHDFRQWRARNTPNNEFVVRPLGQGVMKDYIIDTQVADYLGCKVHFTEFKAYKAEHPARIMLIRQLQGYHKNGGFRAYLHRSALDDFAAWHKVRRQQRKDNANKGTEKLKIVAKLLKIDSVDKTYRILSETKRKTKQELEEIYLAEQQAEINRRMAHSQDIKRRLAIGDILSVDDLVKRFPEFQNIAELFAEYATESEFVIDGAYLPANKVSDFAFVMDLDGKYKPYDKKTHTYPRAGDVFSLSDTQMDKIASRLATGAMYKSERNAALVLLEQIKQEIKR